MKRSDRLRLVIKGASPLGNALTVLIHFEELRIALSDVLMSTDEKGGGIWLPSVGLPERANPHLPIRPTSLVRKFFRVQRPGSSGMFLVCGTRSHIQEVVRNVKGLISGAVRPPPELVRKFFRGEVASLVDIASEMAEGHGKSEFELLGWVDGIDWRRHFAETVSLRLPYWGSVLAMGSGKRDLLGWLEEKGKFYEAHGLGADDIDTRAVRALNGVPSLLLEEDTRAMRTLAAGVGGYYESFRVGPTALRPSDNVLTVFGRFKPMRTGLAFELRRIFFHIYDGDTLVIGAITGLPVEIDAIHPLKLPLQALEVVHVGPFGETPPKRWNPSRVAVKLNSPEVMRLTTYRGANDQSVQRFYEGSGGRRLLAFRVSGGSLHLRLDATAFEHFLSRSDRSVPLA